MISGIETLKNVVPGLTPNSSEVEVCEMTVKYLKFMKTQVDIAEVDKEFLMAHVLSIAVHLDLGHLPDTRGFSGLLSGPCTTTQTL